MNLIIEGCDRQGKSTLAHRLYNSHLVSNLVHFTSFKNEPEKYDHILIDGIPIMNQIRDVVLKNQSRSTIYDRFIYSDLVYAPLYRKDNLTRDIERDYLELLMTSLGTIYIYVESSNDVSKLIDADNDGHVTSTNYKEEVLERYHALNEHIFEAFEDNVITYDWTTKSYGSFITKLNDLSSTIDNGYVYKKLRHYEEIFQYPYRGVKWLGCLDPKPANIFKCGKDAITYDTYVRFISEHPEFKSRTDFALVSYDNTGLIESIVEHISDKAQK